MLLTLALVALLVGVLLGELLFPPRHHVFPVASPSPSVVAAAADPCRVQRTTYCVLNPAVTPDTIATTICRSGWTSTVRPPAAYTSRLKARQLARLGLPGPPSAYEEDHRLPLEGGGDPTDPDNLTPEPWPQAHAKDQAENALRRAVCVDGVPLRAAQAAFVHAWLRPWPGFAGA